MLGSLNEIEGIFAFLFKSTDKCDAIAAEPPLPKNYFTFFFAHNLKISFVFSICVFSSLFNFKIIVNLIKIFF